MRDSLSNTFILPSQTKLSNKCFKLSSITQFACSELLVDMMFHIQHILANGSNIKRSHKN